MLVEHLLAIICCFWLQRYIIFFRLSTFPQKKLIAKPFLCSQRGNPEVRIISAIFLISQAFVARFEIDNTTVGEAVYQFISSNAPVSESIIKPLTTISLGTSG